MRTIETFDGAHQVHADLLAPSLVEDDALHRYLVVDDLTIPIAAWIAARTSGAVAVLQFGAGGVYALTIEDAMERAQTPQGRPQETTLPVDGWMLFPEIPTYQAIVLLDQQSSLPAVNSSRFVHLHTHSEYSALDGLSLIDEVLDNVEGGAVAITDHAVCSAHPELQKKATARGIKPIFGMEANFTDDRFLRGTPGDTDPLSKSSAKYILNDYRHLVLWAQNDQGLHNIWALSTQSNREGFYGRPRIDWDLLERYSEGVMASTACLRGPLSEAIRADDEGLARANIARLLAIFGDRLYVELHTNLLEEQIKVNKELVVLAREFSLPTIVAVDSHYPCHVDQEAHRVWIAVQTNKDLAADDADLFAGDQHYHLKSEVEAFADLASYLPTTLVEESIANTTIVAERCNAQVKGEPSTPVFSKQGGADRDVDRVIEMCLAAWSKTTGKKFSNEVYEARFEKEMSLLIRKKFCGYFLMVADYCRWAKEQGILVGPGRGSGGGCLVAYLLGITDLDPVDSGLMFERFLTEGRTELPDFDIDFPTSKRPIMEQYILDRWGEDSVMRVGTHVRMKSKGTIKALARTLKNTEHAADFKDIEKVCKIITAAESGEAGLGMKWDDLWDQHGEELEPYRLRYPGIFEYAGKMVGRLQTYGKHAAGFVISSDEALLDRLPMRNGDREEGGQMVSQFDMDALSFLYFVKFDFLYLRTLDTIQMCIDLVKERYGRTINVYDWRDEYLDPQVWGEIADGRTLGIFQIETRAGTRLTKRFRPQSTHDLADVITLVRPGPVRSGLTETYFRRRSGEEEVRFQDPRLAEALADTQGCVIYQEQVMAVCSLLAGYTLEEADEVRRILGKKKVEAAKAEGARFLSQTIERGMSEMAATEIWNQLEEFSRYSFNKSHAFGYAVLGYWTAWFKFHYPLQFLVAALSTVDKERIPEFIEEARRMGYKVMPPDINESGLGFRATDLVVRYGLDNVKGVGEAGAAAIVEAQPYAHWEDFLERKGSAANWGVIRTLAAVGAFDCWFPDRRGFEMQLEVTATGEDLRCKHRDDDVALGENCLPCTFDWSSEPVVIGKSGRPLKAKPLPKRCTKACRNYEATGITAAMPDYEPYSVKEIRDREREFLGVFLSSTPFDGIDTEILVDEFANAEEIEMAPEGVQMNIIATVMSARPALDRNKNEYAWLRLYAQNGEIEAVIFKDAWKKYKAHFVEDALIIAVLNKTQRGLTLIEMVPV